MPLTVVGGFLGAGKTTLLNRVLAGAHGVRYGVLVNDFGELAVDAALVSSHGGDTVAFANGCVCCTLGDGFLETVDRLLAGAAPPEQFIVEASGVADPRAIADQATLHPGLARDLTVVLADAETVGARHADPRLEDTVARQLRAADLVVLNKCDRVGAQRRDALARWLARLSGAQVTCTVDAQLPRDVLRASAGPPAGGGHAAAAHRHAAAHPFRTVTLPLPAPVDTGRLRDALARLAVLRTKGFVHPAHAPQTWCLVQGTGHRVSVTPAASAPGRQPALVFVGLDDLPDAGHLATALEPATRGTR